MWLINKYYISIVCHVGYTFQLTHFQNKSRCETLLMLDRLSDDCLGITFPLGAWIAQLVEREPTCRGLVPQRNSHAFDSDLRPFPECHSPLSISTFMPQLSYQK